MGVSWRTYRQFKLGLCALTGVAVLLATPPYRLWALATLPMIVLATLSLPMQRNRVLSYGAYILFGLCGFAVGQFFWLGDGLDWSGTRVLFFLLAITAVSAFRIFAVGTNET